MGFNLGDEFPNFSAKTTAGDIKFHDWIGKDGWAILFSHPADFTPVCTTELGMVNKMVEKFKALNVKLIALSCDDVDSHSKWTEDILAFTKDSKFDFPIIADPKRDLAVQFGMLDPVEKDSKGLPLTCRAVFIVGPDYKLKLSMLYPATAGRNFDEIFRVVESLQLTAYKKVATPANWKSGDDCMVIPSVKKEELATLFPAGVETKTLPSGKEYLRFTPDPSKPAKK
uniref:Glutathione peroxidase A n=1 Tax=Ruditapes philippinarum TaxID=129788 RepID=C8CBM2_RUDPH|nr:glutathione peroxidase A [Ruditapes philippinarum]